LSTPPLEPNTQQQIDALKAEIEALQAAKIARAPWPAWQAVKTWVASKGGWTHAAWISYAAITTVIAADPAAHKAFLDLWAHIPKWGIDLVAIGGPIAALLFAPGKAPQV
jgi:hypothetical protein